MSVRLRRQVCACAFLMLASISGLALRASERTLPPAVPSPEPVALPTPLVRTLPNGLRVLVMERHTLPVLTLRVVVQAGPEADPPGEPGTAQFAASMLNEGTVDRSPVEIAEAVDGAGGTFDSNADWDSTFAELSVLADKSDLAFDLMADLVLHPAFAPAEVDRTRTQTISALDVLHHDPEYLADAIIDKMIFDGTPYGHPADGTVESVKRLTSGDLAVFHARQYVPARSVLAVVGDISPDVAFAQAARTFGEWKATQKPSAPPLDRAAGTPELRAGVIPRVVIVDKPDAVQTQIRVGNPGISRSSPDYVALTVANQILGGPASNRLFSELRGEHGLTYSASSDIDCFLTAGAWVAKTSTRTAETVKAVNQVLEQMKRLRERPISREELEQAVNYLIGHQALEFETSGGIADQFLELMNYHLSLDTWNNLPAALRRLTPDDVWQATRRHLDPDHATIVLVGNAALFEKDIKKLGTVQVVPIGALDSGLPGLERFPAR